MFANEQEATMIPVTATLLNIVVKRLGCTMNRYGVPCQVNSLARKVPQNPDVEGAISSDCASGCLYTGVINARRLHVRALAVIHRSPIGNSSIVDRLE